MKQQSHKNKSTILRLAALTMVLIILLGLCGCSNGAPELDQIYDRVVWLIENSYEANVILFGEGLPVYEKDSDLADLLYIYDTLDTTYSSYDCVSPYASYLTVSEMKNCVEKIYSSEYLNALYESAFDGISYDLNGSSYVVLATYTEDEQWLYQISGYSPLVTGERVYDYSTMRYSGNASSEYVKILIDTYKIGEEEQPLTVSLVLVKENGNWYLDSPTY